LAQIAVWLDPALADDDFDGFVAEALAMGRLVVASRTPINVQRLEKGRTGFLVPARDANETTHAILAALFKPEVGTPRSDAARQTVSKFRPRQRVRALTELYERLRS
jgi:glycosyltransferase involved in cell wall biosynthesis